MDGFDKGDILIYQTANGETKIDVFIEDESIWLNQKQISQLYQKGVNTINEHIKHILEDGELAEEATIRNFRIVQEEGNEFGLKKGVGKFLTLTTQTYAQG